LENAVNNSGTKSSSISSEDIDEAMSELKRCSGTQFDPQIVTLFEK